MGNVGFRQVKIAETNQTLKGLAMSRKGISDDEGAEIIRSLERNQVLERFELDGNQLGCKSAQALGNLINANRSIRVVDIEGNNLTGEYSDNSGVITLIQSLRKNDTLLCLNLNNCRLDEKCG